MSKSKFTVGSYEMLLLLAVRRLVAWREPATSRAVLRQVTEAGYLTTLTVVATKLGVMERKGYLVYGDDVATGGRGRNFHTYLLTGAGRAELDLIIGIVDKLRD